MPSYAGKNNLMPLLPIDWAPAISFALGKGTVECKHFEPPLIYQENETIGKVSDYNMGILAYNAI